FLIGVRVSDLLTRRWESERSLAPALEYRDEVMSEVYSLTSASSPGGAVGKMVGLAVMLPRNMNDGKIESAGQLPAGPIQGIETRTLAGVLPQHLPYDYQRIGIDTQDSCLES